MIEAKHSDFKPFFVNETMANAVMIVIALILNSTKGGIDMPIDIEMKFVIEELWLLYE